FSGTGPAIAESEPPAPAGGSFGRRGLGLLADLDAGSRTDRARGTFAARILDHELDPQRVAILVIRGITRVAQGCQAPLLRACGGGRESGQLEDDPRAVVHLRQGKGHGLPGRVYPDLGAAADRGLPGVLKLLAVTAEHDRLGSGAAESREAAAWTGRCARTRRAAPAGSRARAGSSARGCGRSRSGSAAARGRTGTG